MAKWITFLLEVPIATFNPVKTVNDLLKQAHTPTSLILEKEKITSELNFKAVRSSGAGGQNVNKVASKVVLSFDVIILRPYQMKRKQMVKIKLASRLTVDFVLILNCDEDRSQLKNKEIVTKRFLEIIKKAIAYSKN
jgi:ribosome-associated protein